MADATAKRYPRPWPVRLAYLVVFGGMFLRLTTQAAHTPRVRYTLLALTLPALFLIFRDNWILRRERRAEA